MDKTFIVQQGKKDFQFKIFEIRNNSNEGTFNIVPVGFSGLNTDYPELQKFVKKKDNILLFQSKKLSSHNAPIDIVQTLHKIYPDTKILFSNNYSSGIMEDITKLPQEYSLVC